MCEADESDCREKESHVNYLGIVSMFHYAMVLIHKPCKDETRPDVHVYTNSLMVDQFVTSHHVSTP